MTTLVRRAAAIVALAFAALSVPAPAKVLTVDSLVKSNLGSGFQAIPTVRWIPGTHTIVYAIKDRGRPSQMYRLDVDTGEKRKLGEGRGPVPSPDGRKLAFLRSDLGGESGETEQVWIGSRDVQQAVQVTHLEKGLTESSYGVPFAWSPDSKRIAYQSMSFDDHYMSPKTGDGISAPSVIVYPDAAKPSKNPFQTNRVWIADADGSGERLILTHLGLFGQVSWLNDETIIYDHDDSAPLNALHSLVTAVSVSTGRSWTITSGYNRQPSYAPVANSNGTKIALRVDPGEQVIIPRRTDLAVETIGNRKVRLYTHYAVVGHSFAWMRDGALLFTDGTGVWRRVEAALPDGRVTTVYGGPGFRDDLALSSDDKYLAWILVQPNLSTFIQVATLHRGTVVSVRTLSQASNPTRGVTSGVTKPFSWRSTDALQLDGYVTYPVGYIAGRRYPLIVLIHGGPWTAMPFWSSEWPGEENFLEYFAQRGFVIFVPDYRASGNFGYDKILRERARHRAMQGDFEDIMSGVDALEQKGIVDPKREAVLGHSYGGVEVNWIITHTRRFKAAVSYEGGIDWYYHWGSQYGSDSYATWKLNGTPFTEPDVYRANSAITYAGYIRTPTLFITSEPGRGAVHWLYAAALSNGVPTEDVIYLDERHVVGKPANQRDLVQRITSWIDRYVLSSGKRR